MERMTVEQLRKYNADNSSGKNKNKYHAKKVGSHASIKEHGRAGQLKLMQLAGEISDLREQVSFVLIPAQRDKAGNLLGHSCSYIADFVYKNKQGEIVVEDTKGYRTREYRIKRKLMLLFY